MKQYLSRLLSITLMCGVASIQPMANKKYMIKVVNDLGTPATVTLKQGSQAIKQNVSKSKEFPCFLNDREHVTIQATGNIKSNPSAAFQPEGRLSSSCKTLINKEIHIKEENSDIIVLLSSQKVAPKKQKVSVHKMTDLDIDYTVEILDAENNRIAKSTFSTNTRGPLTKSLYVRLNLEKTDQSEFKKYNSNTIKVGKETSDGREVKSFTLHSGDFPGGFLPQYQIWFVTNNRVQITDSRTQDIVKEYQLQEFIPNQAPSLPTTSTPSLIELSEKK
jgi:hypothetical protein